MSDEGQQTQHPGLTPDIAAWIGRSSERTDVISARMAESFTATLAPHLARPAAVPLGLFWCLAPDIVAREDLGADGHPRTGLFLPAMPYPRRMWAGGELVFRGAFTIGDAVTKTSTIEKITFKTGSTGKLAFLEVRHHYRVGERLVLDERQDIVYREAAPPGRATLDHDAFSSNRAEGTNVTVVDKVEHDGAQKPVPPFWHHAPSAAEATAPDPTACSWTVDVDSTLLFRYSALTFNGHRIHYDHSYATEVESYDGLVVHGPLQATLMLNLAASLFGTTPSRFIYRGQAPLICDGLSVRVEVAARDRSMLKLKVLTRKGTATMVAEAYTADAARPSSNR